MPPNESFDVEVNPQQQIKMVLGIAKRSWFTIFTFLALGLLIGVGLFNFLPKEYESEAKVMLRNNYLFGGDEGKRPSEMTPLVIRARLLDEELKSTVWIGEVLDELEWPEWSELGSNLVSRRTFMDRIKNRLKVTMKKGEAGERLVFVRFRYTDRFKARDFVRGIRDQWLSKVVDTFKEDIDREVTIRREQLEEKNKTLQSLWQALEQFETKHRVSVLRYNQDYLSRSITLRGSLDEVEAEIAQIQAEEDEWKALLAEVDADGNLKIPPMISRLEEIQNQEQEQNSQSILRTLQELQGYSAKTYTDKHHAVRSAKKRLEDLLVAAAGAPESETEEVLVENSQHLEINRKVRGLGIQLEGLRQKQAKLQRDLEQVEGVLETQPVIERELAQRREQITTQQELVTNDVVQLQPLVDKQNALARHGGTQFLPYTNLEDPSLAIQPTAAMGWLALGASIVVGLGIGVVLVAGRELLKSSFTSAAQTRRALKLPVLGEVAPIQTELEARRARLQRNLQMAASLTFLIGIAATIYLCIAHSELLPVWLLEQAAAWREGLI